MQILLTLLILHLAEACSKLNLELSMEMLGNGYHRTIHTKSRLSSMVRLVDCRISYAFHIPKGAYMNVEDINSTLYDHCLLATPFDVEEMSNSAKIPEFKTVIFHSMKELRKVFLFEDDLKFEVHMRYNPPLKDGEVVPRVVFRNPTAYLRCDDNATLLEDSTCAAKREKLSCSCSSNPRCEFIRVEPGNPTTVEISVPAAQEKYLPIVASITIAVVAICIVVLTKAISQPEKPHEE